MLFLKERLVQRREGLNLSQVELAEKAGVSERTIVSYEAGEGQPTYRSLEKIAKALGVKISYLTDESVSLASLAEDSPPYRPQAIAADVFPTALLRDIVKVLSSLVPYRQGAERGKLLDALTIASRELDSRPEDKPSSSGASQEGYDAAAVVAAEVSRQRAESRVPFQVDEHRRGASRSSPGSSPPTKTPHPEPPKPGKA